MVELSRNIFIMVVMVVWVIFSIFLFINRVEL